MFTFLLYKIQNMFIIKLIYSVQSRPIISQTSGIVDISVNFQIEIEIIMRVFPYFVILVIQFF